MVNDSITIIYLFDMALNLKVNLIVRALNKCLPLSEDAISNIEIEVQGLKWIGMLPLVIFFFNFWIYFFLVLEVMW